MFDFILFNLIFYFISAFFSFFLGKTICNTYSYQYQHWWTLASLLSFCSVVTQRMNCRGVRIRGPFGAGWWLAVILEWAWPSRSSVCRDTRCWVKRRSRACTASAATGTILCLAVKVQSPQKSSFYFILWDVQGEIWTIYECSTLTVNFKLITFSCHCIIACCSCM